MMLKRLSGLAGLILFMVGIRHGCEVLGLNAPWYLLHELVVLLIPMTWLLLELFPKLPAAERLAFILTSGLFISMSAIAELLAIEHRYWGFYTAIDPLSGFDLGAIPLEEFLSYPMLLNLPILWYLWLAKVFPKAASARAVDVRLTGWLKKAAWGCGALALAFFALALLNVGTPAP